MRLSSLTGLRRSAAAALTAAGLVSVAALAAPASATAAPTASLSGPEAHAAHLAHLHHLHVMHIARLNTQARVSANQASRSAQRTTLNAAPVTDTSPSAVRALARTIVPAAQWAAFDAIITHESSWNLHATNPSSGAYGLPQALPGSKMASVASDWRTNPVTQIKWGLSYMNERYGSPNAAWAFWQTHHWY